MMHRLSAFSNHTYTHTHPLSPIQFSYTHFLPPQKSTVRNNQTTTWTVKLANVSFYKNVEKGMAPGSGIFIVCDATNGLPLAVFQENRYMTDLRTGAAGAVCVKHFANAGTHDAVSFVGTGVIAKAMARATANVHGFKEGFAYGLDFDQASAFAAEMTAELGYPITAVPTAEECVSSGDVVFTQTTGASHVLEKDWVSEGNQ
jgi:ornithine cyclodeaminase/alanine dehydrogenase-like protein (mu-crystallin family)